MLQGTAFCTHGFRFHSQFKKYSDRKYWCKINNQNEALICIAYDLSCHEFEIANCFFSVSDDNNSYFSRRYRTCSPCFIFKSSARLDQRKIRFLLRMTLSDKSQKSDLSFYRWLVQFKCLILLSCHHSLI